MPPRRPEHCLRDPVLLAWGWIQPQAVHSGVLQEGVPALDEEHPGSLVPRIEDDLLLGVGLGGQAHVAEPVHHDAHRVVQVLEERMPDEEWVVQLVRQLALQSQGELVQRGLQAVRLHELTALRGMVGQVFEDPVPQVRSDLPLPEVPPQKPDLLHLLRFHVAQAGHGARDAGYDGGECNHTEKQHDNGEHALRDVARTDVHGGRRELSQTPM
mmetsp:Transcript_105275/g.335143  ORF Transcript_105275/g.335143 Transcript_105275/m.335143 type:complete len:213 (-) Transcript_105275:1284-1922(-)